MISKSFLNVLKSTRVFFVFECVFFCFHLSARDQEAVVQKNVCSSNELCFLWPHLEDFLPSKDDPSLWKKLCGQDNRVKLYDWQLRLTHNLVERVYRWGLATATPPHHYCTDSCFKRCHQYKMAQPTCWILLLIFCTVGGSGGVSNVNMLAC